ncbi:MFS transporter [Nonomuraea sp. NPDC050556]|uniref:MFS transporter n=1 Tax=Nonomuraea sp. NPDC050556 TaxID=3364369 RepID=UPI00378CEF7E
MRVLRVRDFRLLWMARLVAGVGAGLLVVAIPAHVYAVTGSVMATGFTLAAEYLPVFLLGPYAGVWADRWDRRRLMIATDLVHVVSVAVVLLGRTPDTVWLVYLAMLGEGTAGVLFRPAAQAHTPAVVGTGELLKDANTLSAFTTGAIGLAAPPLGGLLYATAGADAVVGVAIGCYLLSALALSRTRSRASPVSVPSPLSRTPGRARHLSALLSRTRASARDRTVRTALQQAPATRVLLVVNGVYLLANAALTALLVPFAISRLDGSTGVGYLLSALGAGFLLGAPIIRHVQLSLRAAVSGGMALVAAAFFALFNAPSLLLALIAATLVGIPGVGVLVTVQTWVQRSTPGEILGRVSAVFLTVEAAVALLGALTGPLLAEGAGLTVALNAACTLTLGAAALALRLPRRASTPWTAGNAVQAD